MCHWSLFYALAMSYRPQIGHAGPWWYFAPIVAAVVTRATGVRHIYLIDKNIQAFKYKDPLFLPGLGYR